MQDNQGKTIRLMIAGYEANTWDDVTIDSQIDVPADGWSMTLFDPSLIAAALPKEVKAGAKAEIYYGDELILAGIADRLVQSISRSGRTLEISGRDMVGQLIDCSVPIKNSKQITLLTLLEQYALSDLGSIFETVRVQDDNWLRNKVTVEPSESLYDAIAKAAQVTGQFVWFDANQVLQVGDPFKFAEQNVQTLKLMSSGLDNNVISMSYEEDVSNVFNDIKIISQDEKGNAISATTTADTPYSFKRFKIVTMSDIETQAEAQAAINKIQHDNDLEAYTLTAVVPDWTINGQVWKTGGQINLQTDVLIRANATWVVMGRTLKLSRNNGKTTELKLKRKGDWVQPLIYKEPEKKAKKSKKTNADLGLDEDGYGTYHEDAE
jgi:prophage tail gpP-like protein